MRKEDDFTYRRNIFYFGGFCLRRTDENEIFDELTDGDSSHLSKRSSLTSENTRLSSLANVDHCEDSIVSRGTGHQNLSLKEMHWCTKSSKIVLVRQVGG
ncbi:hypothetical protein AVEN_91950-1 [Araneus ventricosus]|uniref:Uncharacterized protein n=1 Tax=Araneus ventricosus TaxID=182803 RepID=A0A4Y2N4J4_ARAVE|nr:hypothetical protein AVEN_91950-1 [Araneus ventricosus]